MLKLTNLLDRSKVLLAVLFTKGRRGINQKNEIIIRKLQLNKLDLQNQNVELQVSQDMIEKSMQRFSDLYDNAPTGYLSLDMFSVIFEVNQTTLNLLNYEKKDLIGKTLSFLVEAEYHGVLYTHIKHLREGLPHTCEVRLIRSNKSTFDAQLMSASKNDGSLGRQDLQVAIMDISERKSLEEMNTRLASIVEGTHDAILSISPEGVIVTWNRGAEKIFGYSNFEAVGNHLSILSTPSYIDETNEILKSVLSGNLFEHPETTYKHKNGSVIPVSFTASPIRTHHGRIIGASIIATDITDRRKWEESILELNQKFGASNRELESLGKVLSHDLQGPIRAISASLVNLSETFCKDISPEGKECIDSVLDRTKRMDTIINGLFYISTVSHQKLVSSHINLSKMVQHIAEDYTKSHPEHPVQFIIPEPIFGDGDEVLIQLAIENMMRNAFMFTSKRKSPIIEFGVDVSREQPAFFIRDNGEGFDMAFADRLFMPFARLPSGIEFTGTGIGLDTAKRIILHHKGEIWGESEIEKGATFYFTLPNL